MNNLARNLIILGLALGIWGVSFLFVSDPEPEDPTRGVCHAQLDAINRAKLEWAKEKKQPSTAVPTKEDLLPYFSDNKFPTCPGIGVYTINAVTNPPQCSITSHTYP
jgi:hypothetical protein